LNLVVVDEYGDVEKLRGWRRRVCKTQ